MALNQTSFVCLLQDHVDVAWKTLELAPAIATLSDTLVERLRSGYKILLCGNGGSAADCQHIATELTVRFEKNRAALPAIALTTDTSALTASVNDFGIESMFARQIDALGREGDVLIGLTTSGNSANVLAAFAKARERDILTIALTGGDGGRAKDVADHCLVVPSQVTARIQEMHILIGHALCSAVDRAFD